VDEINNISKNKKILSLNQSHLYIEYINLTMRQFKQTLLGFGETHAIFFSKKFEKHPKYLYENFKKNYKYLNRLVSKKYPIPIAIAKKHTLNVYLLDMIQSYKSTRHARGLPCRGQRT